MCGRYFYDLSNAELKKYWEMAQSNADSLNEPVASNEIFPSQTVVGLMKSDTSIFFPMLFHWGFHGFKKGQLLINARGETVEEKRTFKHPYQSNRIVLPASGFYEWDSSKKKIYFTDPDQKNLYICGFARELKQSEGVRMEAIILTTAPTPAVAKVHDRMPVLIEKKDLSAWLTDLEFSRTYLKQSMPALVSKLSD